MNKQKHELTIKMPDGSRQVPDRKSLDVKNDEKREEGLQAFRKASPAKNVFVSIGTIVPGGHGSAATIKSFEIKDRDSGQRGVPAGNVPGELRSRADLALPGGSGFILKGGVSRPTKMACRQRDFPPRSPGPEEGPKAPKKPFSVLRTNNGAMR